MLTLLRRIKPMNRYACLITVVGLLCALESRADQLELKSGKTLTGKYTGGTASAITFETSEGVQTVEISQARGLSFASQAATNAKPVGAASTTSPAVSGAAVKIPAGTALLVRMVDPVSSKDPAGKRFTAALETDLTVNGAVVAKAGTKAYGRIESSQQARRYTGQSALDLRLTELAVGPTLVPLSTSSFADASAKSGGKVARGAAAGAAVGAIADGGGGAGKGAAIGAVASGLKKGETVSVPPGTLLEFRLQQHAVLNVPTEK
jgi:hypothetical protein